MLSPGKNQDHLQRWYDRLVPLIASARERLRGTDPAILARRSGCALCPDGALRLAYLRQEYSIRPPAFSISFAEPVIQGQADREPSDFDQALLLTYLVTANGVAAADHTPERWISYRDLPGGMFYAQAFHGYAEVRLVRELGESGVEGFHRAAARLNGDRLGIGDAAYAFRALPRIRLAAVYWPGDEELSAQASILFEEAATRFMSTDGLAVLGSHLVDAILQAAITVGRACTRPS